MDSLLPTSPPTLDFFRSLTTEPSRDKVWAIYVLIIEKPGEKPKLGSGTNSLYGVRSRLANYNQRTLLPRFIDPAFRASYTITHRGLLCWAPIPSVTLVPSARLCFLALEAVFCILFLHSSRLAVLGTNMFYYSHPLTSTPLSCARSCLLHSLFTGLKSLDASGPTSCLGKHFVGWLALCSHVPFMELPEGFDMTDDELLEYAEKRRKRRAELARLYEQGAKAKDFKGFLARRLRDR